MPEKLLSELKSGEKAEIVEIRGGINMQKRLQAMGLWYGKMVCRLSKVGLGGPVVVEVNRAKIAIGQGMAHKILVQPSKR